MARRALTISDGRWQIDDFKPFDQQSLRISRCQWARAREDPAWLARAHEQHLAILDALARRDPQTALAAAQFHLRSAASFRPSEKIV